MGLQALLLGKRVGSPQGTQLAAVANAHDPGEMTRTWDTAPDLKDGFLDWYLTEYAVPLSFMRDGRWLAAYLQERASCPVNIEAGEVGTVPLKRQEELLSYWTDWPDDKAAHYSPTASRIESTHRIVQDSEQFRLETRSTLFMSGRNSPTSPRNKFLLLNNTAGIDQFMHLGCNAVTIGIVEELHDRGLIFAGSANTVEELTEIPQTVIAGIGLIVFNGEGSLHHDSPRCRRLMEACQRFHDMGVVTTLVNCVWHANSDEYARLLSAFDVVSMRESTSAGLVRHTRGDVRIVPDFSLSFYDRAGSRSSRLPGKPARSELCVVDSVDAGKSDALMSFASMAQVPGYTMGSLHFERHAGQSYSVDGIDYPRTLTGIDRVAAADFCVTGRFHAVTAALTTSVPFVALPSNTPKIEGMLSDIGLGRVGTLQSDRFLDASHSQRLACIEQARASWTSAHRRRVARYVRSARREIGRLLDDIARMVPDAARDTDLSFQPWPFMPAGECTDRRGGHPSPARRRSYVSRIFSRLHRHDA